ncbi:rho gtpase-activating protein 8 [Moniliophthora roreri MCA 2997]|uniref:Rho gtpase-activating protein 8 n=1 Tax=Moniliophthora roreri (strain MCA 2997) TaxID=1381753 RepID=V2WLZ3_MONRO|nr:rho gtpase-activating protein 8 [Moniliophthora roreri MCA 2997]
MSPNGLSLKQRLTALSIAPSAPSSPHNYDQSPASPRRKSFFASPWSSSRRHADSEQQESEMVQEVMAKLIFQAGVDFETRPMVVLNASALPDPRLVNYDILLSRILSYLNLYVESDYTVVFFAAGAKHNPGWNWVWKAYRSLSRKYRKNLKRLYVVHSSFFSKMLFSLAGAVISPKFFRKITYIDTLSDLAYHIPLTQIDIPPAVYQENHKHEKTITLPTPMPSSTFGVPLEDIMGYEGEKGGIPRVVRDAIQFLRETGMQEDGLFRRSPSSAMLRAAQEAYDRGNVVSLDTFGDPHLAAVLLKKYLRDLPEPMFPESLYPTIRRCPMPTSDPGDMSAVMYVREILLPELPPCVYILLSHILHLMHEVSLHVATNRMDAHNLSIVLCPNLVKGTNPAKDVMMCTAPGGPVLFDSSTTTSSASQQQQPQSNTTLGTVIKLCIQRYYEIFDEVHDRTEAVGQETHEDVQYDEMVGGEGRGEVRLQHHRRQSSGKHSVRTNATDEEIDDTMLIMPIGPEPSTTPMAWGGHGPPSAWGAGAGTSRFTTVGANYATYKPKSRRAPPSNGNPYGSGTVTPKSASSSIIGSGQGQNSTFSTKSRSVISIEKGLGAAGVGTIGKKGSISVGRGTTRKSIGSGVEAVGITAEGFFTPPPGTGGA